jgi:peptidoglycan hydrolase-like protein with peptidoglycan-binding domain
MNQLQFTSNKILSYLSVFAVCLGFLSLTPSVGAASGCKIASGYSVVQVQKALKLAEQDGILGPKTCSAIKNFQRKRGLATDGIVGSVTAKALGLSSSSSANSNLTCAKKVTSCFIAKKEDGYQGHVYVIQKGELKATYQAVFGGSKNQTPNGTFAINKYRIGSWTSTQYPSDEPNMNYPLYFNRGIAIHGSKSVPDSNGSHGCIRVRWNDAPKIYDWYKKGITQVIVR